MIDQEKKGQRIFEKLNLLDEPDVCNENITMYMSTVLYVQYNGPFINPVIISGGLKLT